MRKFEVERNTKETQISLSLNLDGEGKNNIDTGCGFLNHMLELFSVHSRFDLTLKCVGDTNVDYHHTSEDIGIALGMAFDKAIGNKAGITRYADVTLPMDEALVLCATDISGRGYLNYDVETFTEFVGDFACENVEEFFNGFVRNSNVTLHFSQLYGKNSHHIIEAVFKSFGKVMKKAVAIDSSLNGQIPSSKGIL
jgi:imidazoleglycerol-phosphate dehydratase